MRAAGLADMAGHDGPYLVHCVEGKDRTGFACILLEALACATYDGANHTMICGDCMV